jgi:Ca2+-binding RTX toxin-like protein
MSRSRLCLETLESRDTPAVFYNFAAGALHVWFDNAPVPSAGPGNAQATAISAIGGNVTLNLSGYDVFICDAQNRPVPASQVKEIVIDGSNQPNFIDLRFVSTGTGFSARLNRHITIRGHGGNDVLIGSAFDDRMRGGAGFDQIYAGAGNDWLAGDAGDDWLYGGDGNNVYQGGSGRDWFDRFHVGDRVVDFVAGEFYDPIGLKPGHIGMDRALQAQLVRARWNLGDEV